MCRFLRTFWAPVNERSNLLSIYVAGASFGTVVIFPLAGVLADTLGWREGGSTFVGGRCNEERRFQGCLLVRRRWRCETGWVAV